MSKWPLRAAMLERPMAAWLVTFACAMSLYSVTVNTDSVSSDVAGSALTAWRIAHTGEPWLEGLYLWDLPNAADAWTTGADGHTVAARTPGPILAAVPFYLGSSEEQASINYGRGGLAAATLTASAVACMFLALRRSLTTTAALGAVTVFAVTTPMWSVSADALWTHSVTGFGIAACAWALSRDRWWLAGVWLGVAIFGRPHVAVLAAVVGLGLALSRRSPTVAIRIGITSVAGLVLLGLWNKYVFGAWDIRSGYGHSFEAAVPGLDSGPGYLENLAGFLLSPDRGFLVWTPLVVLLFPAVVRHWRRSPAWTRWLAFGGLAYTAMQLEIAGFSGGDAFYGYRLGIELLVCITPIYAVSATSAGAVARWLAPAVVGVQFAATSLGAVVEGIWLPTNQAWSSNSAAEALKAQPLLVGCFLLAGVLTGALATRLVIKEGSGPTSDVGWCSPPVGQATRADDGQPGTVAEGDRTLPDR